jgi:formylglycine-generating enzyme required for sulfatase activity
VESGKKNHPIIEVTWYGAKAFALFYGFDLPTEAEWEYACRAGTTSIYYLGEDESDLARAGWYYGNANDGTHPIGQKEPNSWGFCDMHGNVWEWCHDLYDIDYYSSSPSHNPAGAEDGPFRVVRGGGWFNDSGSCRSSNRNNIAHDADTDGLGLRVVRRESGITY